EYLRVVVRQGCKRLVAGRGRNVVEVCRLHCSGAASSAAASGSTSSAKRSTISNSFSIVPEATSNCIVRCEYPCAPAQCPCGPASLSLAIGWERMLEPMVEALPRDELRALQETLPRAVGALRLQGTAS